MGRGGSGVDTGSHKSMVSEAACIYFAVYLHLHSHDPRKISDHSVPFFFFLMWILEGKGDQTAFKHGN